MPSSDDYFLLLPNRFRQRQFLNKVAWVVLAFSFILCLFFLISSYLNPKYTKPSILACKLPKYDYNLLAISWTPTFCASHKCINSTETWRIHGLWPNWLDDSKGPNNCCPSWEFFETELKPLLPQLNNDWPNNLAGKSSDSLWKHEWAKHGTCSTLAHSGGMINYFNTTISLFEKYPIGSWLQESNIVPTHIDGPTYKLDEIHASIENKIGKRITIICNKKKLIDSIYLCFESASMALMDCPADGCGSDVILPKAFESIN